MVNCGILTIESEPAPEPDQPEDEPVDDEPTDDEPTGDEPTFSFDDVVIESCSIALSTLRQQGEQTRFTATVRNDNAQTADISVGFLLNGTRIAGQTATILGGDTFTVEALGGYQELRTLVGTGEFTVESEIETVSAAAPAPIHASAPESSCGTCGTGGSGLSTPNFR